MRYQVTGKQIDVGQSLQEHVKQEISSIVEKYAERPTDATIVFSKDRHEFVCETTVHLSTGLTANAKAKAGEIYAAFDKCASKLEKQLRRYKRRLKDHHKARRTPVETIGAPSYILARGDDHEETTEPETLQPIIIAEMKTDIKSLSVGEAVMQMEIADQSVLVFRNESQKSLNVVYKRADGNIGWIDPGPQE